MSTTPSLQSRLRQPYPRDEWQSLMHSLFPDGTLKLFSTPQPITASQEKVKTTLQLGTIDLENGNTIAPLAAIPALLAFTHWIFTSHS